MLLAMIFICHLAVVPGQDQGLAGQSAQKVEKVPFDAAKWELVWGDEFNTGTAPDPEKWTYEVGYIRNNEAQYYTKDRRENARIENGRLVIEARRDNWDNKPITSASITTSGKKSFLYGRIEARAKVPTGRGTWPAIWTLGDNIHEVGWPKCGEIDILENVGYDPDRVHSNIHVEKYNHTKGTGKGNSIVVDKPYNDFNIYAVEWYPDRIEAYFNDTRYFIYRKESNDVDVWPFDKPQYLILNLAIGGAWGGQRGIDEALFPHRFEIDYVRYYLPRSRASD
ncbi:MAG: family 16 glycosylhydrolase [Fimbriimonadaceae bacterium]